MSPYNKTTLRFGNKLYKKNNLLILILIKITVKKKKQYWPSGTMNNNIKCFSGSNTQLNNRTTK